jgi:hypothetical protein
MNTLHTRNDDAPAQFTLVNGVSDDTDPKRPDMDRKGQIVLAAACGVCTAWGAALGYCLYHWLKTL